MPRILYRNGKPIKRVSVAMSAPTIPRLPYVESEEEFEDAKSSFEESSNSGEEMEGVEFEVEVRLRQLKLPDDLRALFQVVNGECRIEYESLCNYHSQNPHWASSWAKFQAEARANSISSRVPMTVDLSSTLETPLEPLFRRSLQLSRGHGEAGDEVEKKSKQAQKPIEQECIDILPFLTLWVWVRHFPVDLGTPKAKIANQLEDFINKTLRPAGRTEAWDKHVLHSSCTAHVWLYWIDRHIHIVLKPGSKYAMELHLQTGDPEKTRIREELGLTRKTNDNWKGDFLVQSVEG